MVPRPVEIELHKFLEPLRQKAFLLAVSGGLDSMAMLHAFVEMRKRFSFSLSAAYIHHGGGSPDKVRFRNQCFELVRDECEKIGIAFYSNIASTEDLTQIPDRFDEAGMRQIRYEALAKLRREAGSDYVVFAHHRDDLLETRLMRLIRGCGPQGLTAMKRKRGAVLRPFLNLNRMDLEDYMRTVSGHWVEDPTNTENSYLRNWLRGTWLPALEDRVPGSKAVLANSLGLIAQSVSKSDAFSQCFTDDGKIHRAELLSLSLDEKKRVFALYLKRQNVKNYGLSHINELVKRLDVERNDLTFKLAQKNWLANARHIWCED